MYYQGESLRCLLALLRIPAIGPNKLAEILEQNSLTSAFDTKGRCLAIEPNPLSKKKKKSEVQIPQIQTLPLADWAGVERDLRWLEAPDCQLITLKDTAYPQLLKEIPGHPAALFLRGNVQMLMKPQIAIVGSRNPTPIGCETANKFAEYFSRQALTVTSGLAIGIDGAAHKGALLGEGGTVAVLGNGLDNIYPPSHQGLAISILEQGGVLVSEFPLGTLPKPSHFPRRNRIISGLSLGVLVVEATLNSGSLITAKLALDQGREIFAIPGSIHSPLSRGCHALIREGAKLVETAKDVLEELGGYVNYKGMMGPPKSVNSVGHIGPAEPTESSIGYKGVKKIVKRKPGLKHSRKRSECPESKNYASLLMQIGYDCTPVESVIERSGLTPQEVSIMLLELELKGCVLAVPGGYARVV